MSTVITDMGRILCIEKKQSGKQAFVPGMLKKGFFVDNVNSGKEALKHLQITQPDVIVINAASLRTSGVRICQSIHSNFPDLPIILIIDKGQKTASGKHTANVVLELPFTIRKLANRIYPYIPGDGKDNFEVGPIILNTKRNKVVCNGKEAKLTPQLTKILKTLMEKPGEVIERHQLFKKIWKTNYTDDTRSLDVHISWLRKAIEQDPHNPKHLITIRGVGYRLDI